MLPFDEALASILERAKPLPAIDVPIGEALGFALAKDISAPIALPPFDNSAMDGFALTLDDLPRRGAATLPVSQIILAGSAPAPLAPGSSARIMTGAPIPLGADAVAPLEDAEADASEATFSKAVHPGQFIRRRGEDVAAGEIVMRRGEPITSRGIALLAAMGLARVAVRRRPSAAVITTGTELAPPGSPLEAGHIHDSNGPALAAALAEMGIAARLLSAKDDAESVRAAAREGLLHADLLIIAGGVSVGDADRAREAVASLGATPIFWRIAMKPGKPFAFWTMGEKLIFGLPGNPVSSLLTMTLLVKPALLKMLGRRELRAPKQRAIAAERLTGSVGLRNFLCGRSWRDGDRLLAAPAGPQGSAMIKTLAEADCLLVIPEERESIEEGEAVEVEFL